MRRWRLILDNLSTVTMSADGYGLACIFRGRLKVWALCHRNYTPPEHDEGSTPPHARTGSILVEVWQRNYLARFLRTYPTNSFVERHYPEVFQNSTKGT